MIIAKLHVTDIMAFDTFTFYYHKQIPLVMFLGYDSAV